MTERTAPGVFGVVLGAGAGARMGGPKTRLVLDGRSLLEHHVERLRALGCRAVAAVVRPGEVAPDARLGARVLPARTESPAASLALALRSIHRAESVAPNDLVVIVPVDMLPAHPTTLAALIAAALASNDVEAVTPRYRGRGGHPVVVRAGLVAGHLEERDPPPLRDIVRRARRVLVEVDDDAVLSDLDTPDDLAQARRRSPALRLACG